MLSSLCPESSILMMYAFVLRTWCSDLVGVTCFYICGKDKKVNNSVP